jgi:hypothetical protein
MSDTMIQTGASTATAPQPVKLPPLPAAPVKKQQQRTEEKPGTESPLQKQTFSSVNPEAAPTLTPSTNQNIYTEARPMFIQNRQPRFGINKMPAEIMDKQITEGFNKATADIAQATGLFDDGKKDMSRLSWFDIEVDGIKNKLSRIANSGHNDLKITATFLMRQAVNTKTEWLAEVRRAFTNVNIPNQKNGVQDLSKYIIATLTNELPSQKPSSEKTQEPTPVELAGSKVPGSQIQQTAQAEALNDVPEPKSEMRTQAFVKMLKSLDCWPV